MKNKFEFVCAENDEYGGLGWRLKDQPGFDPLPGNAVAHDVLEHFPGGDESPAHEFMALGAALLIRGTTGFFQRRGNVNPPHVHVASDFPDILRHVTDEGMELPNPGRTKPIENYDHLVTDTINEAARLIKTEWPDDADRLVPLVPLAAGWMRKGWRKAERRYSKCGINFAIHAFEEIMGRADKILKSALEGATMTVILDTTNETVRVYESTYDEVPMV